MFRNSCSFLALLPLVLLRSASAGEEMPPAAQWLPQETIVSLEISDPEPLFDKLMAPAALKAIQGSPAWQQAAEKRGMKDFAGGVRFLEASLGVSWQEVVRKLAGRGISFALWPDNKAALILDGDDAQLLSRLHQILAAIARNEAEKAGNPGRVAWAEYRAVTGWTFNGEEAHAVLGTRFILANHSNALKAVIDLREESEGKNLASAASYQAARKAAGSGNAIAFANLAVLKQHPPVEKALQGSENPLASLLFSGILEALRESNWLTVSAKWHGDTLSLSAVTDGKTAGKMAAFARPQEPEQGIPPNLDVPRRIAAASFYRDLHGFYATKDQLFPERTSGLIFFENMMGIFFSGRDLTQEVLAELQPEVRLAVAEQVYDPQIGRPKIQVPSFAAVFRMAHPDQFMPIAEEAWQKVVGLVNFTRGQQGLPGLIIDRPEHGDAKFTIAYFSTTGVKDKNDLETRFNFRPALARVGDSLVLSSTEGLARDLIDALKQEASGQGKPLAGVDSLVEVDATDVASLVQANREHLVRNNMVEKGKTQEEAETEISVLGAILERLGQAKLTIGNESGLLRAVIELKPNLP